MKNSLRSKLLFQFTTLVLICMLVIPSFIGWQMNRQFRKYSSERFEEDREQLVKTLEKSFAEGRNGTDVTSDMLRWPIAEVTVYNSNGTKIYEVKHISRRKRAGNTQKSNKNKIRTLAEDLHSKTGEKTGKVIFEVVPFKLSREGFLLRRFQQNLEIWIAVMLVLSAFFAIFMTERIIRPVLAAAKRAELISKGYFPAEKSKESDIKEIQALTDSVDRLGNELAEQENLRKRLMSDIAHELRNPVTVIKAHLEAIEDGIWEPTPERIALTISEIDRLSLLIKEVEKLTTIEKTGNGLILTQTNLAHLAEKCALTFTPLFENKGVKLTIETDKDVMLALDPAKIRQVVENLLSNALRYTDKGGIVQLSLKKNNREILLSVKDSGIGIADEDLPNIFERFYRTDKSRTRESGGMGIGLAVVKAIIEAHGAKIYAESKEGQGSTFIVKFPLAV